jgi:hypothetical protein
VSLYGDIEASFPASKDFSTFSETLGENRIVRTYVCPVGEPSADGAFSRARE